jgi:hypothetical protein
MLSPIVAGSRSYGSPAQSARVCGSFAILKNVDKLFLPCVTFDTKDDGLQFPAQHQMARHGSHYDVSRWTAFLTAACRPCSHTHMLAPHCALGRALWLSRSTMTRSHDS